MYWKEEHLDKKQMRDLQSERLIKTVKRVYDNVPYYRAKMDRIKLKPSDIKSIDDIVKLPFTEKHDLRANYPFGLFAVDRKKIVRLHASSGTTGKLTVVGYTKADLDIWADSIARALSSIGVDENSCVHIAYGYGLFTGGLGIHYGVERLGATAVPVSTGNTVRQLMLMKDFASNVLCCTPSYAIYLAETIKAEGYNLDDFNLKVGVFGAEPWTEEMRQKIEQELKIKAYDIYGLSEIIGPGVAMECSDQSGFHIQEDLFYPEIIDTNTLQRLPNGQLGEIVFTTLNKEGMPLLRYRTRDITMLKEEKCPCGRTTIKMDKLHGRSDDMLIIRGVNVFPSQIESVLLNVGKMITPHYQIVLDKKGSLDTIEIKVELEEHMFSDTVKGIEEIQKQILYEMQSMLGISAKISLVSPHSLPRSEGKAVRIIDNRK